MDTLLVITKKLYHGLLLPHFLRDSVLDSEREEQEKAGRV